MNPQMIEITEPSPQHACNFCHRHELNPIEWGAMYQLDKITLHYFCLLFSAGLNQNGQDNEGIWGFLVPDIRKEIGRGKNLKCAYCKKDRATVGCVKATCKRSFHYTCGIANGTLHQFYDQFCSFCPKHKPTQTIPKEADWTCPICFVEVESRNEAVWPPCCGKSVFHRSCLMRAAKSAGYFFKCPLCNNSSEKFLLAMKCNGVFVPEEDAAWEREPNAFAELQEQYSKCDAKTCLCPTGRDTDDKAELKWKIIRCGGCGATATHAKCADLQGVFSWKCETCVGILADNSRVNLSDLASTRRSLRTHVDEENLNYSSDSEDRTSEGSDSDDTSDEEDRIAYSIPNAISVIQRGSSESSSEDSEAEIDNLPHLPQLPQPKPEPKPVPPPRSEKAELSELTSESGNGVVFNLSMNKQYRLVRQISANDNESERKRKRKQSISNTSEQDKKRNKCEPPILSTTLLSKSNHNQQRQHAEKSSSTKRRKLKHSTRVSANPGRSIDNSEGDKLQSIFQNIPSTSSQKRREEEARRRNETIKSILQQSSEQVFDFSNLPKIPKLARPPRNSGDDDKRKSILNTERLRQQEEERIQATRNLRGVDPKIFYHKRHETRSEPVVARVRPLVEEFSVTFPTPNLAAATTNVAFAAQNNTFNFVFQASPSHNHHEIYSVSPTTTQQTEQPQIPAQYADTYLEYGDNTDLSEGSRVDQLWYPFDDDGRNNFDIWEPPNSANDEYSKENERKPPGRAVFTDFHDDSPTVRFRKSYTSNSDRLKLSRRNYRRRECDEARQTEKFYNPHSAKAGGAMNTQGVNVKQERKPQELKNGSEKRKTAEGAPGSEDESENIDQAKANASESQPVPPDSTLDDDEVQIASPTKKPVKVIEVIDLSDSEEEVEVLSTKVVLPPITTVKSAAFLSLLSGKPNPIRPSSSASSSSSAGPGYLFYHNNPLKNAPHDFWFNHRNNQRKMKEAK